MKTFIPIEVLVLAEIEARSAGCLAEFRRDGSWHRAEMIRLAKRTVAALKRAGYEVALATPESSHE